MSGPEPDPVESLRREVERLRRELAELREAHEQDRRTANQALADLTAQVLELRTGLSRVGVSSPDRGAPRDPGPDRVGLFVDVQNMYYAARQLNARLDYGALMGAVTRDRRLVRAFAYVVQNRDIDQSGFLAMLQQKHFEVKRKGLKIRQDGSSKGDWDMEIALDMLRMAGSLDVAVLVSGDGDFTSLLTRIKSLGPRVEVYSFPGSTARELIEAADRHVPIDDSLLIRMPP
ncbi:MAG TPA: NYN domain-containing protein, partial [Candidatus Polarisedimenticolia bacterium]|nr:NYN domain-containing protein [Candidatus Polarisedimenticolia bacterium]